ncbi:hypothetical protein SAMN02927935_03428 [Serratia nematodiphila]|uniref:Uncharacterized protein n=1 Tax=Serratia nematodiphila TaxID=458197 RepID=A0A1G5KHG0_9GAMM|nr:hypothetical protein SAMN02927935_03428 [Serratia nematodiphila]
MFVLSSVIVTKLRAH